MSINSITGMRVALNRNPGDNMNVQLDNTYFGTYHVDSAPTDGKNDGTLNGSEGVDGGGWSQQNAEHFATMIADQRSASLEL